ncbi:histone deacetylase family protein [Diaphorobacter sp. HDW4A]|uniref:histone deacetylase family protein n=1 Tax=Diaphorobacter sp. HDW4A TaxID=2714924 RepID=UPI0014080103|nr:histone deacetylase family protein [Diaphorobacter sp. HDW4A]QIL79507.1 histone deacetylase family protein [Diaphorobacter sp. HDW4A]
MQAFFDTDQLLHDPQQFMRLGRICHPTDVPDRAHALIAAVQQCGGSVNPPRDWGVEHLHLVHSADYIRYLSTAYTRWQALADVGKNPGIEVLPNLSPYSGVVPGERRVPCRTDSLVAQTGFYLGDLSCPLGPQSWRSILRSAHSAASAAQAVLDGASMAYALCRPSGHHAHHDRASGFCYVNNAALAAQMLAQQGGKVAVLDVDAHHGDGTQNIFYARGDVLTVSTHADTHDYFPFYTGYADETGSGDGLGCNLNLPLAHGSTTADFLPALDTAIERIARFAPSAVVLSIGFDTYRDDPISVLRFDFDAYQHVGERLRALGLPLVVVQEGGYMVEALGPGLTALMRGLQDADANTF